LNGFVLHVFQLQIQSIFIDESPQDIKIWTHFPTGMYSVKSGYQWLTSNFLSFASQTQQETWQWIWKLNLPENLLKHFIWLAMHGNIPMNSFRAGRHLTLDSSCKRCRVGIESLLHTFRDCPLSLAIWDALLFNKDTNFNSQDFNWWFKHCALAPNGNIFVITCWVL